jgi:hypothetical protein
LHHVIRIRREHACAGGPNTFGPYIGVWLLIFPIFEITDYQWLTEIAKVKVC